MFYKLLKKIDSILAFEKVSAHCDIPCGIYDPITAQIAALTVIRMDDLIAELGQKEKLTIEDQARLSRLVAEKETHAVKVKEEIRIIWGDFLKEPQFQAFPQTHGLVHKIMLQGSRAKQHLDRNASLELLNLVNEFAEIFWQSKKVPTYKAKCPYAPAEEVVYPKLG
ncbi:MAG: superoxide dismutase, Ni [Spirochaetales bacterium]|nr:MAG: superoxide dismutase, Ni [Spirochaetales bacterium]